MVSHSGVSCSPFELKGLKKSKFFELSRVCVPLKNIKTGHSLVFFIELCAVNSAINPKQVQFASTEMEKRTKADMDSFILLRAGTLGEQARILYDFFSARDIRYDAKNKKITLGTSVFSANSFSGGLGAFLDSIEWNLSYRLRKRHYILKHSALTQNRKKQKVHTLYTFLNVSGTVRIGSEKYEVLKQSLSFFDCSMGLTFLKPVFFLSSHNCISLISGKKLQNTHFLCAGFLNQTYKTYLAVKLNEYNYRFKPKEIQVVFNQKEDCFKWSLSVENNRFLIDIDVYANYSDLSTLGYSFQSPQRFHEYNQFFVGTKGYGEFRIYKKNNKRLEIIEHARIEDCLCEQAR